ncbi:MAG: diheme cytochrome C [Oscillatoriales cyanobacterium C42_A2020_001]|nr:diheme cytochrome C [Leptolyngbyaceae cyanobacterium C42_A2020_001]
MRRSQPERRRSILVLLLLLLLWSICLGVGLAQATEPRSPGTIAQSTVPANNPPASTPANVGTTNSDAIGTVDVVPQRFQQGQTLYLENCATCHIGIPPAVMPTQTWRQLIQDSEHYGVTIQPVGVPEVQILWQYLREYSRPLAEGESTPYRIQSSRIFATLHPRVKFTEKVNLNSCVSCHPGAGAYDFRRLTAEWQNAP